MEMGERAGHQFRFAAEVVELRTTGQVVRW